METLKFRGHIVMHQGGPAGAVPVGAGREYIFDVAITADDGHASATDRARAHLLTLWEADGRRFTKNGAYSDEGPNPTVYRDVDIVV